MKVNRNNALAALQERRVISSITRAKLYFCFVVHEDYAKLERVRVVSDAIIEGIRREI